MISICTVTANTAGQILINDHNADYRENRARTSRTMLLGGGVYINHGGVSDGDRTLNVSAKVTATQGDSLWYLFRSFTELFISISDGVFIGVIEYLKIDNGQMRMQILLKNKEN